MTLRTVLTAVVCLSLTSVAYGQRDKLKAGDDAPKLDLETWVKGSPVALETGNVYIVEFWATWCAPCKAAIPHLTSIQQEYEGDLQIIAVSTEDKSTVESFVAKMGSKMDYTVAVDRRSATQRAWMKAAGIEGIPASFIIDKKGRIAWIGNPHADDFDEIIGQVVKGRFDPVLSEKAAPTLAAADRARSIRNWNMCLKYLDQVIEMDQHVFADVALDRYEILAVDMGDTKRANAYAAKLLENYGGDVDFLCTMTETILTDPRIPDAARNQEIARSAAERAVEVSGERDPGPLSALALVHFNAGEIDQAIELQRRAYFRAAPQEKPEYRRVLTTYHEAAQKSASRNRG